jgi:hypothetical protein
MKVDVVFSLEDFVKLGFGRLTPDHVRICIEEKPIGDITSRFKVWLSVDMPDKILKCMVSEAIFDRIWLQSPHENEEQKRYKEWQEKAYKEVEEKLGFKPIEGYWTTTEAKEG